MQGVTIVNTVGTLCEYSGLTIGTEYETKCKSGTEGVVYAFSQNATKDGWIFNGHAVIDEEVLLESLTVDEINKAVLMYQKSIK